ncbi:Rieske (2Fe-2S) protein [Halobaculum gomorrense]|uniref:Ferredoxin subunit of nitrite reductase or a ring-hydroxylating dioxygenase n=1 Tax=Halobaculum gomorrense TaxID=43928 RepID=A0A1M5P6G7_9EURY|nr:Rieske 2Fe-2S domain-containing protein [Halobaculum gomorrense]SHG96813.1 Ferredoxin subunit of nitrite reductase or a ring-hydroxylating dioxygenase [Halobaculum gomorrense]
MNDPVHVTVESDDEATRERIFDSEGEVEAGDATFRFSVGGAGDSDGDSDRGEDAGDDDEPEERDGDPLFVAPLSDVPTDSTIRRTAMRPDGRRGVGFILRRGAESGEVFAWRNSCPHRPEVPLDPGRGARVDGGEIVCHEHGARFECGDGLCTWGPCVGEELDPVGVEVRDGDVYLDDERFASVRPR